MNVGSTTQLPSSCLLLNYKALYRQRHREFLLEDLANQNGHENGDTVFVAIAIGPFQISLLEHAKR
jgi:hypothetical protein